MPQRGRHGQADSTANCINMGRPSRVTAPFLTVRTATCPWACLTASARLMVPCLAQSALWQGRVGAWVHGWAPTVPSLLGNADDDGIELLHILCKDALQRTVGRQGGQHHLPKQRPLAQVQHRRLP